MNEEAKCECQHCGEHIAFPVEMAGQRTYCPHCEKETMLSINPAQPNADTDIFLGVKDEQRGPFAKSQVLSMWNNGRITSDAIYWHEGMPDWSPISLLIREFAALSPSSNPTTPTANPEAHSPTASGVNVSNLLELAKAAAEAGNHQEAYGYCTKALEYSPRNSVAWAGKGEAAGWLSTIDSPKTTEMIAAFKSAIEFAHEPEKEALRQDCARKANTILVACYSTAKKYVLKFKEVPGAWQNYVNYCRTIIAALILANEIDPTNDTIIENIIHISTDNKNGLKYTAGFGLLTKEYSVTPEYKSQLTAIIETFSAKLRVIKPE